MSQDDRSDLIDSGGSSEKRYMTWPPTVPDQEIVDELVRAARTTPGFTFRWGWDPEEDTPDIKVWFFGVDHRGNYIGIGSVVMPDPDPDCDDEDAPWRHRADSLVRTACGVLANDVLSGVERALDVRISAGDRGRSARLAFLVLTALIRMDPQRLDDQNQPPVGAKPEATTTE